MCDEPIRDYRILKRRKEIRLKEKDIINKRKREAYKIRTSTLTRAEKDARNKNQIQWKKQTNKNDTSRKRRNKTK